MLQKCFWVLQQTYISHFSRPLARKTTYIRVKIRYPTAWLLPHLRKPWIEAKAVFVCTTMLMAFHACPITGPLNWNHISSMKNIKVWVCHRLSFLYDSKLITSHHVTHLTPIFHAMCQYFQQRSTLAVAHLTYPKVVHLNIWEITTFCKIYHQGLFDEHCNVELKCFQQSLHNFFPTYKNVSTSKSTFQTKVTFAKTLLQLQQIRIQPWYKFI